MPSMEKTKWEKVYKSEKDPKVVTRILAVYMVHVRKKSIDEIARDLMQSSRWVRDWLKRFDFG